VDVLFGCRLFSLVHMQHLDLSYNLLTSIPSDIQNMKLVDDIHYFNFCELGNGKNVK